MSVIHPSTPNGYSLFCDDLRQEDNGKQILIGLYSSDMLVNTFPIQLPNFRVLIVYHERLNESRLPVRIVITAPSAPNDDITIFEAELPRESFDQIPPPSDNAEDPLVSVTLNAGFSGLVLMNPGRIKVRAYRGEDEIRLGTLRVRLRSEWEDEQRRAAEATKEAAN
jgi:hypothetical protein